MKVLCKNIAKTEPNEVFSGITIVNALSWEGRAPKCDIGNAYIKLKLSDGTTTILFPDFSIPKICNQIRTRLGKCPRDVGDYIERPIELIDYLITTEFPLIIKRSVRVVDGVHYWESVIQ